MALCFNRYAGQSIVIGAVQIDVVETHRSYVKLRVHAPEGTTILRAELAATLPAPAPDGSNALAQTQGKNLGEFFTPPASAPSEPRTENPSRVVAASAPAAGAVCEPPPSSGRGGAAGTQGGAPRRRVVPPPLPPERRKRRR